MTTYNHLIERSDNQPVFNKRLEQLGFDNYGNFYKSDFLETDLGKKHPELATILDKACTVQPFKDDNDYDDVHCYMAVYDQNQNPLLIIRPFFWGDSETISDLPNFEACYQSPEPIKIEWYKYALRAATSNEILTPEFINNLFDHIESELIKLVA